MRDAWSPPGAISQPSVGRPEPALEPPVGRKKRHGDGGRPNQGVQLTGGGALDLWQLYCKCIAPEKCITLYCK
eukprot:3214919-Pyramimonas_sp.AAC.1